VSVAVPTGVQAPCPRVTVTTRTGVRVPCPRVTVTTPTGVRAPCPRVTVTMPTGDRHHAHGCTGAMPTGDRHHAHRCTGAMPTGLSSSIAQPLRAWRWDRCRGRTDAPFPGHNPRPRWAGAAEHSAPEPGSQPRSAGTGRAASSAPPGTHPAAAPGDAWPGPQQPSLVLGGTGTRRAPLARPWARWPGRKAASCRHEAGPDPRFVGDALPARPRCRGGRGEAPGRNG